MELVATLKKKKSVVSVDAEGCILNVRDYELKVDTFFLSYPFADTCKINMESSSLERGDESISLSAVNTAIRIYRLLTDLASPLDKVYLMSSFGEAIDRIMRQNIMIVSLVKSSYLTENMGGTAALYTKDELFFINASHGMKPYQITLTKFVAKSILKFILESHESTHFSIS